MLRNGEQLLLAVVIPVIVLVGGVAGARRASDLDFAAPAGRRVHARRARAGGDVDGVHVARDRHRLRAAVRRDQAARRLAAAPLRPAARQGRRAAAGRGAAGRRASRAVALALGWEPALPALAGRRAGGRRSAPPRSPRSACSSPACCAPRRRWPPPTSSTCCCWPAARWCCRVGVRRLRRASSAGCRPARSARRCGQALIDGDVAWRDLGVLLVWAVLGTVLTARTFKWE